MVKGFQKKFTLLELLIVIAIIGILLSLLLPSLTKAKEQAKMAYCLANQKQIAAAFILYATNHDSFMPPGDHHFPNLLVNNDYLTAPRKVPAASWSEFTVDVELTKEASVFKCPSGLEDRISNNVIAFNWNIINHPESMRPWRSMNDSISGKGGIDVWYGVPGISYKAGTRNGAKSGVAFNNFRVRDRNPKDPWPQLFRIIDGEKSLMLHDGSNGINTHAGTGGRISARHVFGKYTNALFFDGHASPANYVQFLNGRGDDINSGSSIVWQGYQW